MSDSRAGLPVLTRPQGPSLKLMLGKQTRQEELWEGAGDPAQTALSGCCSTEHLLKVLAGLGGLFKGLVGL